MKHWQRSLCALLCALLLLPCVGCSEEDIGTALNIANSLLEDSFSETSAADASGTASDASLTSSENPTSSDPGSASTATSGSGSQSASVGQDPNSWLDGVELDEEGTYSSEEDVAAYLVTYHHLPDNYITKNEAKKLGWNGGSLEPYAPGKCIGGSRFGNYEGRLPENTVYYECDIDTLGAKKRGAKRLVYSEDYELIYYTSDHYETFTLVYGDE